MRYRSPDVCTNTDQSTTLVCNAPSPPPHAHAEPKVQYVDNKSIKLHTLLTHIAANIHSFIHSFILSSKHSYQPSRFKISPNTHVTAASLTERSLTGDQTTGGHHRHPTPRPRPPGQPATGPRTAGYRSTDSRLQVHESLLPGRRAEPLLPQTLPGGLLVSGRQAGAGVRPGNTERRQQSTASGAGATRNARVRVRSGSAVVLH